MAPHHLHTGRPRTVCYLFGQACLADSWLTAEKEESSTSCQCLLDSGLQLRELWLASDEHDAARYLMVVHRKSSGSTVAK
jgi:hypothetical protein